MQTAIEQKKSCLMTRVPDCILYCTKRDRVTSIPLTSVIRPEKPKYFRHLTNQKNLVLYFVPVGIQNECTILTSFLSSCYPNKTLLPIHMYRHGNYCKELFIFTKAPHPPRQILFASKCCKCMISSKCFRYIMSYALQII